MSVSLESTYGIYEQKIILNNRRLNSFSELTVRSYLVWQQFD